MQVLQIKNVILDGKKVDVTIAGNRFTSIEPAASKSISAVEADTEVIDAEGMAILPPFYNAHTHAAMSLLRGYADDMPLFKWLSEYIWPYEEKLTAKDIRLGSRLAALEMIKSGTVFFNDMYFAINETVDVVDKMGMRAAIGVTMMENHGLAERAKKLEMIGSWQDRTGGRVQLTVAPHAIYTVGPELLRLSADSARKVGMKLHIHLSETEQEVSDCIRDHGTTPVRYLDSLGFLGPDVIAAHCVHVDDEEIAILAERGVTVVHNPCSNMKLSSGVFPAGRFAASGCRVALGTDGCSSNNNLDMQEEMKFAALLAKCSSTPETLPAPLALQWATSAGAEAFNIDAGTIAVGKLADAVLVNLSSERLMPGYNLVSDWVYAASSSCIDTVICDGRVIMRNRHVPGEEDILSDVAEFAARQSSQRS